MRLRADGMESILRIAMWSGPRNISTAMMRSFEQRPDTIVCDEPLYAHYLKSTGIEHPGREEVIARHESDWRKVAAWLTGPIEPGRSIFYQKHMSHHLLPEISRDWLAKLTHCFLIRDPREMLVSLLRVTPRARLADTGLPQQSELFEQTADRIGGPPPVVDARDVLLNPRQTLTRLCERLGLTFDGRMLRWPPGPRKTDGVWAPHWYAAVERSTGFERYRERDERPGAEHAELLAQCVELYERLHRHRLR
ncbi:MAG: hypothetical protein JNG88_01080 [Phycisphaerales bacterium]|nr:hypothetical protein [Phycisphaerales bacterium]